MSQPTTVRAKFVCSTVIPAAFAGGVVVHMNPVYSADPASENKAFSDATPSGTLQMHIAQGKPAADAFQTGRQYYVDITPAD